MRNFRLIAVLVVIAGIAVGLAFGAGIAYGRGNPKKTQPGLTDQQLRSLIGTSGAQGSGGGQGATNPITSGRVTAVDGQTITVDTGDSSVKVNILPSTTVTKSSPGSAGDLATGSTVVVAGTRKSDGSVDAVAVGQIPAEALRRGAGAAPTATP